MEKEIYLLIGTVFGAIVGAVAPLIGAKIHARFELTRTRESHEFQSRMEEQKLAAQQEKERCERLREKLEEVHQLLTKISMYTTPEASYVMRTTGTEYSHERREKSSEDVSRLQMLSEVYFYFTQARGHIEAVAAATQIFWNQQETILFLQSKVADNAAFNDDLKKALAEISQISLKIRFEVLEAKNRLSLVAASLSPTVTPSSNADFHNPPERH
jgi:valyl-tRNA synthetase